MRPNLRPATFRHAALVGLLALAGTLLTLPASADQAPSRAPSPVVQAVAPQVPPGCRPNRNPPPTEYGVVARVESGSIDAGVLKIDDMDISICGVLRLVRSGESACPVSTQLVIPSDGVKANALRAIFDIIPDKPLEVPVSMSASATRSTVSCSGSSSGGFKADLNVTLQGRARLFGLQCVIPFAGVAKAVITGPLLSPPYEGTATLKGDGFTVAKVANHDKYCPGELPARIDRLARLPITKVPIDLTAKITVYQDPA